MAELLLKQDEEIVISSHAHFGEVKFPAQLKTGDAFLTSRWFVFKGQLLARTFLHLAIALMGGGRYILRFQHLHW